MRNHSGSTLVALRDRGLPQRGSHRRDAAGRRAEEPTCRQRAVAKDGLPQKSPYGQEVSATIGDHPDSRPVHDQGDDQYPPKRGRATIGDMAQPPRPVPHACGTPARSSAADAAQFRPHPPRRRRRFRPPMARRRDVAARSRRAACPRRRHRRRPLRRRCGLVRPCARPTERCPIPHRCRDATSPSQPRNRLVLLAAREIGLWPGNEVMVPAAIVALAAVVIWAPAAPRKTARLGPPILDGSLGALGDRSHPRDRRRRRRCPIAPVASAMWAGRSAPSQSPSPASV